MTFSVIITVYNKTEFIQDTLKSAFGQTFKDFEIIVINDGSTDDSLDKIRELQNEKTKIINQENRGVSAARNKGAEIALGDYLAFLDGDDLWLPNHLEVLFKLIENYPEAGLYCTAYSHIREGKISRRSEHSLIAKEFFGIVEDYFQSSIPDSIAWTSAVSVKKIIFQELEGFKDNLKSGQDTELWVRIALNHDVAFSNEVTVYRMFSEKLDHLSNSKFRADRAKWLNNFKSEEKNNHSLRRYLNFNRFSAALDAKIHLNEHSFKNLVYQINPKDLNLKQKLILRMSSSNILKLKKLQKWLYKNGVYLSPFK
ncbi:glycosyltransferase family 2 protein [Aegicerativicinus sediminis]|uniref:glycosyltransferase family 2 protein n=1 Tax=Aegicerativicinus sediminis TaxID=2893202 RepID=UPI001E417D27|nr:glycosyltransferase family 2 protein [Aegicerativicinus sediminis]